MNMITYIYYMLSIFIIRYNTIIYRVFYITVDCGCDLSSAEAPCKTAFHLTPLQITAAATPAPSLKH